MIIIKYNDASIEAYKKLNYYLPTYLHYFKFDIFDGEQWSVNKQKIILDTGSLIYFLLFFF